MCTPAPNLLAETLLTAAQASRRLPPHHGHSGHLHPATLHRWMTRGVRTPLGVVRLDSIQLGSQRLTSLEALYRFAELLHHSRSTATAIVDRPPPSRPSAPRSGNAEDVDPAAGEPSTG